MPMVTTLILPENLDLNIEAFCAERRISKNAGILFLISEQLKGHGYRPNETPRIKVYYKRSR
jgi:hypothetical protein